MTQIPVFNDRMVFIILFSRKNSSKEQPNESNVYSVSTHPWMNVPHLLHYLGGDCLKVEMRGGKDKAKKHREEMAVGARGKKHSGVLLCSFPHSTKL